MKEIIKPTILLLLVFSTNSCKKSSTSGPASNLYKCKPKTESTTLSGNNATYEYTYSADGSISSIKKFLVGSYHILQDSIVVSYNSTINYTSNNAIAIAYDANIFKALPSSAKVSTNTQHNYFIYFFSYDSKDRLIKVSEHTPSVLNDYEYDLTISYNDQDNVTALSYENSTGPRGVTVITTSGYDNKPTPFAGIKNWFLFMHAAWNNYDPEPILTALSKNNPLGYVSGAYTRAMTYTYNDKGFPTIRTNVNTIGGNSATFVETYDYQCQ